MSDEAVPAIKPSRPEEQPMIPQPLVELARLGSGIWNHGASGADRLGGRCRISACAPPTAGAVWYRAVSAAAMATPLRTPVAPRWISPR